MVCLPTKKELVLEALRQRAIDFICFLVILAVVLFMFGSAVELIFEQKTRSYENVTEWAERGKTVPLRGSSAHSEGKGVVSQE